MSEGSTIPANLETAWRRHIVLCLEAQSTVFDQSWSWQISQIVPNTILCRDLGYIRRDSLSVLRCTSLQIVTATGS